MSAVICRSSESKGSWYGSFDFGGGVKEKRCLKQETNRVGGLR